VCTALFHAQSASAGRLEAGTFIAHDTSVNGSPVRIDFQEQFDVAPIVVALIGSTGTDAAKIRITNITTTGFDELIIEPNDFGGTHITETIHYIAVEPGRHVLPDGRIIEAGRQDITAVQHGRGVAGPESFASISYSAPLPILPAVLAHIQSANSETRTVATQTSQPYLTSTHQNITATGFELALERSEVNEGPIPSAETVGWIAFPSGTSGIFPDVGGNNITWSGVNTASNIQGFDEGCFTNSFGQSSASAVVIAKKSSHFGGDGGWIRRCSLSDTQIGLTVDEDTSRDSERRHISETASIIAFSQPFHALLEPDINVSKTSIAFTDGFGTDFALPNAMVEYLITVSNNGNAPANFDSIVVTEILPPNVALIVTDFAGPGSGPVQFSDGSPASGLSFSFGGLSDGTDSVFFSTDGTDFSYTPTDGGDGTDPAVTHIRIAPTGFMAPNNGSGATSFTLRLKTRID